jgi:hypothetical protein
LSNWLAIKIESYRASCRFLEKQKSIIIYIRQRAISYYPNPDTRALAQYFHGLSTSVLRAESEICERCSGYLRTSCFSAISIDNQTAVFHFDSQGSVSELDNSLLQAQNVMMPIVHSPCLNSLTA